MPRAATRLEYYSRDRKSPRRRRLIQAIIGLALLLAGTLAIGVVDLISGSGGSPRFLASISPSGVSDVSPGSSCPPSEQKTCPADQPGTGKPVEIEDITGEGDSLLSVLSINVCDDTAAGKAAESLASAIQNGLGQHFVATDQLDSGMRYAIYLDAAGNLTKATVELDPANVFHCAREGNTFRSWKEDVVLEYKTETLSFQVRKDIVRCILAANETKELAMKLLHVFRWDIDFQADARKGDTCKIVFERRYADDTPVGYGRILYAVYEGKRTGRKTACLFNGEYYDENGVELKKDYLRAPLNTLRKTSGFGMRIHPVLNIPKFHTGVDYGAPVGTPVYAIANGTVTFSGCGDAYGLYVCVRHDNGAESRYSHLSRILAKAGQRVKQRQTIGLVGSTGRSTGPHLFFEIRVNGKPINPERVRLVRNPATIPAALQTRFKTVVNSRTQHILEGLAPAPGHV